MTTLVPRNHRIETFETWDDRDRRFDLIVAASSWHWVDPSVGCTRAHQTLHPGGRLALLGHVVIRRTDEPEVYAATADLHERFAPGNPDWGTHPSKTRCGTTSHGWGPPNEDSDGLFGPTIVRWYPTVQHFDGAGFADLLRTQSPYRRSIHQCASRSSMRLRSGSEPTSAIMQRAATSPSLRVGQRRN